MNIPMVDLRGQYQEIKDEVEAGIAKTIDDCSFIMGPNVRAFEQEAAEYLGVKHAIGCANGTDALHLALLALGIGEGDEVITTPFTFIATAEAIRYVGATPVFVDVDPDSYNIDIDEVEKAITENTKAVMPVHLFGQPVDMPRLKALCDSKGLKIVEDCAQSFGATVGGKQTGTFGDIGCTSFFPSKNLGCFGDGGMVYTDSDDLAEQLRTYHNHGSKVRYHHDVIGYNSRLDDIQAVVLRAKLKHLDSYNQNRRRVALAYREGFEGSDVKTPVEDGIGVHVYHQYTTIMPQREKVQSALSDQGIACAVYYPIPLHQQKAFAEFCKGQNFPISERIAQTCLSLPVFPEMTQQQIDTVVAGVLGALNG